MRDEGEKEMKTSHAASKKKHINIGVISRNYSLLMSSCGNRRRKRTKNLEEGIGLYNVEQKGKS